MNFIPPQTVRRSSPLRNILQGRPVLAIFELTLMCNSACGYCDLPLNEGRYELSRAEINRIFTDLYRGGVRYLFIQGGEPLVRKDLAEVMEDLAAIGFTMTLVTNGTRFTPALVERLNRLPLSISVSLDTLDRETYKLIRGRDQLPRVLKGIETLQAFDNPKHLTCIVSNKNLDHVTEVAAFARAHGFIPVFGAYHWDVGGYGRSVDGLRYDPAVAVRVFEDLLRSELVPKGFVRNYLADNIRWLKGEGLNACDAGRYSVAIDASGNVSACLAMGAAGNLRDQPLSQILGQMDHGAVKACSDASSCNLLCARAVGTRLRRPWERPPT